jgi:endoglucanase
MKKCLKIVLSAFAAVIAFSPANAGTYNYAEVLQKSMWFYEVQRSGALQSNNRVEWRGNSAMADGSDVGHDLSGGWYDAGDNMKFNFPMASAVTLLAWGGLEYYQGYRKCGQWGWLLNNLKWADDYLIKCHTSPNEFYGQIGIGMTDHKWWGSPEVFPNERPAFKIDAAHPGSDLAAEAAAALASSSLIFRGTDTAYAALLLSHAKQLYAFADAYRGLYSDAITDAASYYKSWSGYQDELVWGAIWLYLATEDPQYLTKAENGYDSLEKEPQSTTPKYKEALSWDDKTFSCYVLLAKITNKAKYHTDAQRWLDWWSYGYKARIAGATTWSGDSGIAYTPKGLAWIRDWGPLRYSANTAFAAFVYGQCTGVPSVKKQLYHDWACSQVDYALGSNEQARSYVCGFGTNPPVKPHHRAMHGAYLDDDGRTPALSRHILFGALVGGPSQDGSYADDRLDATRNEVADDYNAGFSSALARMVYDFGGAADPNFPQAQPRDTEYMVVAKINTQGNRFTEISATIQNRTTWPARYSNKASIRYFFDISEITKAGLPLSALTVTLRGDSGMTISGPTPYNNSQSVYYVEISFAGDKISPAGQSAYRREAQFRISLPDTASQTLWDPTNDPSYKGLTQNADTSGDWLIPAYENGTIVWGTEPDGAHFVPPSWNRPVIVEPAYNAPIWKASLFQGGGNAVKNIQSSSLKNPYSVIYGRGRISVFAQRPLIGQCVLLDGKVIKTFTLDRGRRIDLSRSIGSGNVYILRLGSRAGDFSRSEMVFPF